MPKVSKYTFLKQQMYYSPHVERYCYGSSVIQLCFPVQRASICDLSYCWKGFSSTITVVNGYCLWGVQDVIRINSGSLFGIL